VREIKCGITEEKKNAYRDLVGKTKRKTPDLKIRRRWADIISIIFKIMGQMKSGTRQRFQLYQVQYQSQIDVLFCNVLF
jgi:hypothetical protein